MKDYVVAIDLGTSCTAYSWKSASDPNPPVGVPDMGPNDDIVGKSPTSILLGGSTEDDMVFKPSGALAYGRVAQRRYAENDIPHGAQLFKRFKMQLHNKPSQQNYDDLIGALTKSASRRAEMLLMDIFVIALEYIKNAALERMAVTEAVRAENVTWVLTVPVCCSDPAKYFMRQAAIKGGFIKGGGDDEGLVLCMEPIAACLALGDRLSWKLDDKYLVIDCGGGTVDISSFTVISVAPPKLDQVGTAFGGPWGSTNVDKQFEGYLKDFVISAAQDASGKGLEAFFASSAMYRILQAWERAKVSLECVTHDCRIDVSELSREPLEVEMEGMDYGRNLKNKWGEEMVGGYGTWDLVLRPALLRKFFTPPCESIAQAVSEQLEAPYLQGLTSVVMVGGFSGSVHVQEAVRACVLHKYPDNSVNVTVSPSPDLAVVQGAAHYVPAEQIAHPQHHPAAPGATAPPQYNSIISSNSYGILVSNGTGGEIMFDPFFLLGENYALGYVSIVGSSLAGVDSKVEKGYSVQPEEPFVLIITSCASLAVRPDANRLDDVGGSGDLQTIVSVKVPAVVSVGCCGMVSSKSVEKMRISVEFSLNGIELHVRVKSSEGQVLLQQTVPFPGGSRQQLKN